MSTVGGYIPANRWQMALTRMGKHTFSVGLLCLFLNSKLGPAQHGIISLPRGFSISGLADMRELEIIRVNLHLRAHKYTKGCLKLL